MANARIDENYKGTMLGVTDDANLTPQPLRVDPVTYRLLTDTSVSSVTISGGTIDVLSSGTVNIGAVTVSGGTINTLSDGTVRVSGGSITITNSGGTAMAAVDAAGNLMVSLGTKLDSVNDSVTAVGTINVQTITSISGGTVWSVGNVAHDAADQGNPILNGGHVTTSLAGETMAVASDRTYFYAGTDGVQIVRPNNNLEDISSGTASMTAAGSVAVIAAAGANIKTYITDVTLGNTGTGTTVVYLQDGSVCKWIIPAPPAGGATVHFTTPLPGTANTAWNVYMTVATTTLYASLMGFKSKI